MSEAAVRDALRDVSRRLSVTERALSQIPTRPANDPPERLAFGTVKELIDAQGLGEVRVEAQNRNIRNPYDNAQWVGSRVLVQTLTGQILISNAATILQAEYDSGTKTLLASYGEFSAASTGHFDDEDVDDTTFAITDPTGLLADVSGGDIVFFAVRKQVGPPVNELRVVSGALGGGGGSEFPGWPGPDPGTGTTTLILLKAYVNQASDVASSDATFPFDGATVAGALGPESGAPTAGTCDNCGHGFTDGEQILVAGDGTSWQAIKLATNWIKATVNVAGGVEPSDGTFTFNGITALVGTATALASPVAINVPALHWEDDEPFLAFQRDDGDWQPVKIRNYFIRVRGQAVGAVTADDATFTIDNVEVLQGDKPPLASGELTISNVAKIPLDNNEVVEVRWNKDEDDWETEPLACHQVLGLATAGVSGGTFAIDNIELVCGSDPRSNPASSAETLSVTNPFSWDIDNNGQVLAVKKADGTWIAVQAACPA